YNSCSKEKEINNTLNKQLQDSVIIADSTEENKVKTITAEDIVIEKEFLYDQYTLADSYPYKDTIRIFQWDKIRERLALLENIRQASAKWAILQNYKNKNGEAPLVKVYRRNEYKRIADTSGVERYQSVPLFLSDDTITAIRYGRDGALVRLLADSTTSFFMVSTVDFSGEWFVPRKYIKEIHDTIMFNKAIIVDRNNENIVTLEKVDSKWLVRSMNPATTGLHKPPYQQETPLGMFIIQEKKTRMIFLKDGSIETGGFAPYANRFTNGGYIHGIPVNEPRKNLIEYSQTLGTTPRSHMCVRNATSHAKFIYDWAPIEETVVFVIE
ncbi:L,D-transpeptidase, partial [Dysgonomonas sp. Marseille-P4677]|uniref:L,D-transpeptidase n=1 Tax=Dysgonomonas sp. Marseille-P4677 TaxID=2364790 RepID=UPI001913B23C